MKTISFIIPVFRNRGTISITYDRICEHINFNLKNYKPHFIFVNDGSDDGSLEEILHLKKKDPLNVSAISFSRNFGQVPAMVAGYRIAEGDLAINLAADLQDPIELISKMVHEWEKGSKIVLCYRTERDGSVLLRAASSFFYRIINLSNPLIPRGGFDICLMDNMAVKEFNKIKERNRFFQGDITSLGYSMSLIPYKRLEREIGVSQATLKKKLKYFIDGWLNTSYLPIRIMSFLGIFISFSGFLYALIIIVERLFFGSPFKGWAPLMIVILTIGGLLMFMLGIIGEYIWRIYDEVRGKAYYIIEEEYSRDE